MKGFFFKIRLLGQKIMESFHEFEDSMENFHGFAISMEIFHNRENNGIETL
jgi:hypothetical protein